MVTKKKNKWSLYILECADKSLYTGITNDVENRLAMHRSGKGSKYVRTRLPFKLVYLEKVGDRSQASKREYETKRLTKQQKLELIRNSDQN